MEAATSSTKAEKFKVIAEGRLEKSVKELRKIGKLSNVYSYDYTEPQVDYILSVLRGEIEEIEATYKKGLAKLATRKGASSNGNAERPQRGFVLPSGR